MMQTVEWFDKHIINSFGTVVILLLAAIITLILRRILRRWLTYFQDRLDFSHESGFIISRVITTIVWVFAGFIILNIWGVGFGGAWAVVLSTITLLGVTFIATWSIISNFMATFLLVIWRPFQFGQTVEVFPEGMKGRVAGRNLIFTTLREESGSVLQIPNTFFFQRMFRVGDQAETEGLRFEISDPTATPAHGSLMGAVKSSDDVTKEVRSDNEY